MQMWKIYIIVQFFAPVSIFIYRTEIVYSKGFHDFRSLLPIVRKSHLSNHKACTFCRSAIFCMISGYSDMICRAEISAVEPAFQRVTEYLCLLFRCSKAIAGTATSPADKAVAAGSGGTCRLFSHHMNISSFTAAISIVRTTDHITI